jgi:hypothetical protein
VVLERQLGGWHAGGRLGAPMAMVVVVLVMCRVALVLVDQRRARDAEKTLLASGNALLTAGSAEEVAATLTATATRLVGPGAAARGGRGGNRRRRVPGGGLPHRRRARRSVTGRRQFTSRHRGARPGFRSGARPGHLDAHRPGRQPARRRLVRHPGRPGHGRRGDLGGHPGSRAPRRHPGPGIRAAPSPGVPPRRLPRGRRAAAGHRGLARRSVERGRAGDRRRRADAHAAGRPMRILAWSARCAGTPTTTS